MSIYSSSPIGVVPTIADNEIEAIMHNRINKGQFQCKICGQTFITGENITSPLVLICPYCGHALVAKKTVNTLLFISVSIKIVPTTRVI